MADAWIPNVATTALGIAITVTVVERILRRDEQRRRAPLTEPALWDVLSELRAFCECVAREGMTRADVAPTAVAALERFVAFDLGRGLGNLKVTFEEGVFEAHGSIAA